MYSQKMSLFLQNRFLFYNFPNLCSGKSVDEMIIRRTRLCLKLWGRKVLSFKRPHFRNDYFNNKMRTLS
jgi:hypothetical protein